MKEHIDSKQFDLEYRFAVGKISEEIFDKHGLKLKTKID